MLYPCSVYFPLLSFRHLAFFPDNYHLNFIFAVYASMRYIAVKFK